MVTREMFEAPTRSTRSKGSNCRRNVSLVQPVLKRNRGLVSLRTRNAARSNRRLASERVDIFRAPSRNGSARSVRDDKVALAFLVAEHEIAGELDMAAVGAARGQRTAAVALIAGRSDADARGDRALALLNQ